MGFTVEMDAEEAVILQREIQMTEAEEVVNKLVEALMHEVVPFEDKCSVMAMLRHLLRNTCHDAGYTTAMHSLMATANITSESPNLAMFAHFTYVLLMKNAGHSSQVFPKVVLSLMEADQCCCDEDLKQKTLLAIWNNQDLASKITFTGSASSQLNLAEGFHNRLQLLFRKHHSNFYSALSELQKSSQTLNVQYGNHNELLDLPLEVLELMALRWKLGLELQCLQLCHNKEHIPEYLIKLCAGSPRVFQACLSIFTSFLLEYNGHQQVRKLIRDLIISAAVTYQTLWRLFPVGYQKLALFLQVDPDIYPKESTAGISRDFVLGLLTDVFCNTKNSSIVPGLIMISCFPKWLPHLVEYFNNEYKTPFFSAVCFVNKYCVDD